MPFMVVVLYSTCSPLRIVKLRSKLVEAELDWNQEQASGALLLALRTGRRREGLSTYCIVV